MKRPLLFVLVSGTLVGHGWRAEGRDVGVVAEYRPASGRYVFQRGTDRVPVQIGTVVRGGDRITLPAGSAVIVQLGTGRSLTLERTDTVPDGPALGGIVRFLASVPKLFDSEFRQSRIAASRGGERCGTAGASTSPLEMPVLSAEARIVSGTRDLPITWLGGCGPYAVVVMKGSDTVAVRRGVDADRVRLDRVVLPAGEYRVLLSDGAGHCAEGRLEAVTTLPELPPDLAADRSELGVVAQAVWLSDVDGGRWRFDAFERLRPLIRAGNALAGSIADGILWGRPTDRPQR